MKYLKRVAVKFREILPLVVFNISTSYIVKSLIFKGEKNYFFLMLSLYLQIRFTHPESTSASGWWQWFMI